MTFQEEISKQLEELNKQFYIDLVMAIELDLAVARLEPYLNYKNGEYWYTYGKAEE